MLRELSLLLNVSECELIGEFKRVHQAYGNSEQPFAALELPSVKERFPTLSREQLVDALSAPFRVFNTHPKRTLALYEGVFDTLQKISNSGIRVVGHTEAPLFNSYYRMNKLGIHRFFIRLYALEGRWQGHPIPGRERNYYLQMDSWS